MPILVWNDSDKAQHLKSFDGDTVLIGPKARGVQVGQKFNWHIPTSVKIKDLGPDVIDPHQIVKGRMPLMSRTPPRGHNVEGAKRGRTAAEIRAVAEQKKRTKVAQGVLQELKKTAAAAPKQPEFTTVNEITPTAITPVANKPV